MTISYSVPSRPLLPIDYSYNHCYFFFGIYYLQCIWSLFLVYIRRYFIYRTLNLTVSEDDGIGIEPGLPQNCCSNAWRVRRSKKVFLLT
jgi:hypothetical protein